MCDFQNRLRKLESEREDRMFASKWAACFIYLPCLIALGHGFLLIVIDLSAASHSIVMASLLGLVAASISTIREKIIRQDKALQQLQERYEMLEQRAQATESYEGQENEKAN